MVSIYTKITYRSILEKKNNKYLVLVDSRILWIPETVIISHEARLNTFYVQNWFDLQLEE